MVLLRHRFLTALFVVGMLLGGSAGTSSFAQATPARAPAAKPPQATAAKGAASTDLLDINTATAAQLKVLPGIGDEYTKRIIAGRPYTVKTQLLARGIVPQATYDKIKDQIVARRPK